MLIVTLAKQESNGGRYSSRLTDAQIQPYLTAARDNGAILILDIQPGRSAWMDEVRHYSKWLKEPDVSLALDPEWKMGPNEIPIVSDVIGRTSASEINEVSAYMQRIIDMVEAIVGRGNVRAQVSADIDLVNCSTKSS